MVAQIAKAKEAIKEERKKIKQISAQIAMAKAIRETQTSQRLQESDDVMKRSNRNNSTLGMRVHNGGRADLFT